MNDNQLFNLSPQMPKALTIEQRVAIWRDLMDTSHKFLLAGLRHKIGPEGDLDEAFREWYRKRMNQRDKDLYNLEEGDHVRNIQSTP
ncbi:MAG: hypothetical protein O3B01_15495 [Planctomycetota bacterium]|nr:hypothetical protein [Planctomycetota bacterium]